MDISGSYLGRIKKWVSAMMNVHVANVSVHHTDHKAAQSESAEFKNVNLADGEIYKIAGYKAIGYIHGSRLLSIGNDSGIGGSNSLYIGDEAGKNSASDANLFIGKSAGKYNTGSYNTFLGTNTGIVNLGYYNVFIGQDAGRRNTTGDAGIFIGQQAGSFVTTGKYNVVIGYRSGRALTTAGRNVFIGFSAGYYETGSEKLIIDNRARINEADARIKALIYGIFDATTANQLVRLNGVLELTEINEYADNAAAITGGLAIGGVYRTGDVMKIVH